MPTGRRARRRPPSAALVVLTAACAAFACGIGGAPAGQRAPVPARAPTPAPSLLEATATLARWRIPALSREAVIADGPDLIIAGGLRGSSTGAVLCADPSAGRVAQVASLALPTHDAGGVLLGGQVAVLGGGASTVYAAVQSLPWPPGGGCGGAPSSRAMLVGALPRPRADLSVAREGETAYVVGGYDGERLDPSVLATADGRRFSTLGALPVPVRYAAVVALGPRLWVLGGQASAAPGGPATDLIQRLDLRTGAADVVGHLPEPVAGAAAVVLDGRILVLGGQTGSGPTAAIVVVDPATARTAAAGRLPLAVAYGAAAVAGGAAWLVGGEGPAPLPSVVRVSLPES